MKPLCRLFLTYGVLSSVVFFIFSGAVYSDSLKSGYIACRSGLLFNDLISAIREKDDSAFEDLLKNGCTKTTDGVEVFVEDASSWPGITKVRVYNVNTFVNLWTLTESIVVKESCSAKDKAAFKKYQIDVDLEMFFPDPDESPDESRKNIAKLRQRLKIAITPTCLAKLERPALPPPLPLSPLRSPLGGTDWACEQKIADYRSCKRRQVGDIGRGRGLRFCSRPPQRCGPY